MLREFKEVFQRPHNGHIRLIIINVSVFLLFSVLYVVCEVTELLPVNEAVRKYLAIPPKMEDFLRCPWTVITYAFVHSQKDLFHILFNMVALYWFGRLFVEYLGSAKVIAVYILGALAAAAFYLTLFNTIPFFMERSAHFNGMVGASGAVFAVMAGIATLLPDYSFYLLFLGPVRIKYIAAFYIVLSFIGTVGENAGGNVAHLGGALMGYIYIKQLQAGKNFGGWITRLLDLLSFRKSKVRVTYRRQGPPQPKKPEKTTIASQEEIDAILDKISEGGYESLSREEKEKLFKAGEKN